MADLPPSIREHLDLLAMLPERGDRIDYLIGLSDRFREVPPELAARPFPEEHRVPQCESEAYVWAVPRADGGLDFHFAVENPQGIAARSLAVILGEGLSGLPPEAVLAVPADLVYDIFGRELSMGKNLGLMGMVQMTHAFARRHLAAAGGGAG